jgi:hypothetical protein
LLGPALLDHFTSVFVEGGINAPILTDPRARISLLSLFFYLGFESFLRKRGRTLPYKLVSSLLPMSLLVVTRSGLADRVVVPDGFDIYGGEDWLNRILARLES